ncbi:hypothetical protein V1477_015657 [Vespula maculifrons]|uniref:Uncharacterized protein n=1 Tax=Vespula maculifrons TaxID=7453 RepID=A0ABD2BAT1_VESMC
MYSNIQAQPMKPHNLPAVCCGLIPIPSSVIIADVAAATLNSSAANFNTAVNGVVSGTLSLEVQNTCNKSLLCDIFLNAMPYCTIWLHLSQL